MAARVTLFIFCYFLFLINVSAASEESTPPPSSSSPQKNSTQAVKTTEGPANKMTPSTPSTPSVVKTTEGPANKMTPSTPSTPSVVKTTEGPANKMTPSTPSTPSVGTTSAISTTSALSANNATTTNKTTQSVHTTGSTDAVEPDGQQTNTTSTPKTISKTEHQAKNISAATTENNEQSAEDGDSGLQSGPKKLDTRYLWFLVLGLAVVVAVGMYMKFRCFKVQQHPVQTMDHGTENASFQRTESNKDGVMLLGVKSGGEENAAAK